MIAVKRVVSTSFWEDNKVIETFTPEDKYFMLYLLTNPHTTQLGIYQVSVKQMAWETGYSTDSIKSLLERFEKVHQVIIYSKRTSEIAIKNYLCYAVVKGGKPVLDCLERDLKQVKNKDLFYTILDNLKDRADLLDTIKLFINNHIKELEDNNINNNIFLSIKNDNDNDIENDNANDNDNETTHHVSCSERTTYRSPYVKNKENREKEKEHFTYNTSILNNYIDLLKNNRWSDLDIDTKNEIIAYSNKINNETNLSDRVLSFRKEFNDILNTILF